MLRIAYESSEWNCCAADSGVPRALHLPFLDHVHDFDAAQNDRPTITVLLRFLSRSHRPHCEDACQWRYCDHSSPRGVFYFQAEDGIRDEVEQDRLRVQRITACER